MKTFAGTLFVGLTIALAASFVRADGADALKDAGLTKHGVFYVLPGEADVIKAARDMRVAKMQMNKDVKARQALEQRMKMAKSAYANLDQQERALNDDLSRADDRIRQNQIISQINNVRAQMKDAEEFAKKAEEELKTLGNESTEKYSNLVTDTNEKIDQVTETYKGLSINDDIKAALDKLSAAGTLKFRLGPSPEFTAAAKELAVAAKTVSADTVAVKYEGNVPMVDVTFNGKVTRSLILDSGASYLAFSANLAEAIGLVPTAKDPTIKLQMANGQVVDCKQMTVKSVRVGRFTVENVECVVCPKSLVAAPDLLGGSFLGKFVYRLDPDKSELHLTPRDEAVKAGAAGESSGGKKNNFQTDDDDIHKKVGGNDPDRGAPNRGAPDKTPPSKEKPKNPLED